MELTQYLAFIVASAVILIVPGPTVTLVIAKSMREGLRSGLLIVAGTQAGLASMLLILALGLDRILGFFAEYFWLLKLLGAVYLVWLGIQLLKPSDSLASQKPSSEQHGRQQNDFIQGFLVIWANPKALLFFGAFIPQFISDPHNSLWQVVLLGVTFMLLATLLDGAYALMSAKLGRSLSGGAVRKVEKVSGLALVSGGLWLATKE